jgi:hypothetical protein
VLHLLRVSKKPQTSEKDRLKEPSHVSFTDPWSADQRNREVPEDARGFFKNLNSLVFEPGVVPAKLV